MSSGLKINKKNYFPIQQKHVINRESDCKQNCKTQNYKQVQKWICQIHEK